MHRSLLLYPIDQSILDHIVILNIIEINVAFLIKQNVGIAIYYFSVFVLLELNYKFVIEFVPVALVLSKTCVMAAIESATVQDDCKEVIELAVVEVYELLLQILVLNFSAILAYTLHLDIRLVQVIIQHKVTHIEPLNRIVHWSVLLLVAQVPLEALKRDDQNRRSSKHLNLFDCLLVRLTLAAVPLVLP